MLAEDEFQVAFETALDCGLDDVVLADQPIEQTASRLVASLRDTVVDLLTPGGWCRVSCDLRSALLQLAAFALAASDYRILGGTPLAVVRYLYQSPAALPFVVVSCAALALAQAVDEATGALPAWQDGVVSVMVAIVLTRAIFVALIAERNTVLARNIRDACLASSVSSEQIGSSNGRVSGGGGEGRVSSEAAAVVAVMGLAHLEGVRTALELDAA